MGSNLSLVLVVAGVAIAFYMRQQSAVIAAKPQPVAAATVAAKKKNDDLKTVDAPPPPAAAGGSEAPAAPSGQTEVESQFLNNTLEWTHALLESNEYTSGTPMIGATSA